MLGMPSLTDSCAREQVFTVAIGASMVYGATQEALGYRTEAPPNFTGDPFEIVIPQLTATSKVITARDRREPQ
jgi:hypothetical protein